MRILAAEDDATLSQQIKADLSEDGRAVDIAEDGEECLFLGAIEPYDLVVMDIGLSERDGNSVLKEWRKENVATPVLILTERDGWSECIYEYDGDRGLMRSFQRRVIFGGVGDSRWAGAN